MLRTLLLATLLLAAPAEAAHLTFGRATEQSAIDPQFSQTGNNGATSSVIFDQLVRFGAALQIDPAVARWWRGIDPMTWEIKLRPGIHFHDGSAFTGADVAFSLNRVRDVPHSPAPFSHWVSN